ncbi:hypothetical protein EFV37_15040 [Mesorhizobium loti]|jgi:hypothetical protein|uniref:Uncharacterized protein n=1 Tax=Mesorhizobium jarvisii TaxID=1777867 RepID=A0A6M7TGP9_9HYPH|nr:hypothetical protein A9K72_32610 [Mesorhizobium loti]QKC63466.1 hypothetical protein EB229_15035 [Mesorhizobium jarvisii]BCH00697.1 hypothetical protein MesoLj131b_26960 [Mesorhizobium sp. 131-2-5]BCH08386.1 hypothetical protein MesoLj131c_26440 [Mesorhizobium sp. 131-3-5]QKD09378.1 hypothetical protein EFV37_15040 [Mesorhizobium loti]
MEGLARLWRRVAGYAAHPDPLTSAANWIALVVAWNQPFYPLYLWAAVGADKIAPSFLTFMSTPIFLAVPAVAKRHALAARVLLPLTGIANEIVSTKAFGVGSGVEIFLVPCALIGAALFRPSERAIGLFVVGLSAMAYFIPHRFFGEPLAGYTAADNSAMAGLNALSAATLIVFIGWLLSGAVPAPQQPGDQAPRR